MSRRVLGTAALAATLLTSGLVPLLGTAHAGMCASWTDTSGDAAPNNNPSATPVGAANLDVVAASVRTIGSDIVATVQVRDLNEQAYTDYGDEFLVQLSSAGSILIFTAQRNETTTTAKVAAVSGGGTGALTAAFDPYDNTVTMTATQAELDKAAGKPTAGVEATNLAASAGVQVNGTRTRGYDSAPAPATARYTVGAQCSPAVAAAPLVYPSAGCKTFGDVPGDGTPTIQGTVPTQHDPDLDITEVALSTTPTRLFAFVKIAQLGAKPAYFQGDRFELLFKAGDKSYVFAAGRMGAGKSLTTYPTRGSVGGTTNAALKVWGRFDIPKSTVVIEVDRAALEKVHGGPLGDRTTITEVSARTVGLQPGTQFFADTAQDADAAKRTYTFGTSPCFPVGTKLALSVAKAGSLRTVTARLTTTAGQAVAAKPVTFYLNGRKGATILTGAAGTAVLRNVKPGTTVKAVFSPAGSHLGSTATTKA